METGSQPRASEIVCAPTAALDLAATKLVTYAPERARRWMEAELQGLSCCLCFAPSLAAAFQLLREQFARRVLVVDLDALTPPELVELRVLRKELTGGTFIALGRARPQQRVSLRITHVVPRPFGSEALRFIIDELDARHDTVELRRDSILP